MSYACVSHVTANSEIKLRAEKNSIQSQLSRVHNLFEIWRYRPQPDYRFKNPKTGPIWIEIPPPAIVMRVSWGISTQLLIHVSVNSRVLAPGQSLPSSNRNHHIFKICWHTVIYKHSPGSIMNFIYIFFQIKVSQYLNLWPNTGKLIPKALCSQSMLIIISALYQFVVILVSGQSPAEPTCCLTEPKACRLHSADSKLWERHKWR